jgi:hypothetical protein
MSSAGRRVRRQESGRSAGDSRKANGWIIALWRDSFQRHVKGPLDGPFIVCANQSKMAWDAAAVGADRRPSASVSGAFQTVGPVGVGAPCL